MSPQSHLEAAHALHLRWVEEVVEGGGFCPFAKHSRRHGRSVVEVVRGDEEVLDAAVARFFREDYSGLEVMQLVFPGVRERATRWRSRVQNLARLHHELSRSWAFAAFHPEHPGRPVSEGGVVGLLRRSPFPMVQLVSLQTLSEVRSNPRSAPVAASVAHNNGAVFAESGDAWLATIGELIAQAAALREREGFATYFAEASEPA